MQPDLNPEFRFSTILPIIIFSRPVEEPVVEWAPWFDRGPGSFTLPADRQYMIKIKQLDDGALCQLCRDLDGCTRLVSLDLAENRKVTDEGLECLKVLLQVSYLNLSSCDITNSGLEYLLDLQRLRYLNLSYCHRLTDTGLRTLKGLPHLEYLDLQGVLKVTTAGLSKIRKAGLTIRR